VLDFSGLGPKTTLNITLPQLKLPKQGSITIVNSGAAEPQFLDLTGVLACVFPCVCVFVIMGAYIV
jgi:hypothetical protein